MNLNELLTDLSNISGVIHYKPYAAHYGGEVEEYTFWIQRNNVIRVYNVDILIKNKGEVNEEAICYNRSRLEVSPTPFLDEIKSQIPQYLQAHPEIEKYSFESVSESRELATLTLWVYDQPNDLVTKKQIIVYKKNGSLTIRNLGETHTIAEVAQGIASVIEQGISTL